MTVKQASAYSVVLVGIDQLLSALSIHFAFATSHRWLPVGSVSWLLAAVFLILVWFGAPKRTHQSVGWVFLIAGYCSNLVTVLLRGSVIDYLIVGPFVINGADICITLGIGLIFLSILTKKAPN